MCTITTTLEQISRRLFSCTAILEILIFALSLDFEIIQNYSICNIRLRLLEKNSSLALLQFSKFCTTLSLALLLLDFSLAPRILDFRTTFQLHFKYYTPSIRQIFFTARVRQFSYTSITKLRQQRTICTSTTRVRQISLKRLD